MTFEFEHVAQLLDAAAWGGSAAGFVAGSVCTFVGLYLYAYIVTRKP
jgi:hypothetical protein